MTWPASWNDPLRWLMRAHETETLQYFISVESCPRCEAKPGDACVTLVSMAPGKEAGRETATHGARSKKGRLRWEAYKGACKMDAEMVELEKQVRALAGQVARARRIQALQDQVGALQQQLDVFLAAGWNDQEGVTKLEGALVKAQKTLAKLSPPAPHPAQ